MAKPPIKRPPAPAVKVDIGAVAKGAAANVLDAKAQYDAGGTGRRMRGWTPPTAGPNRAIVSVQRIRDRARDSVRNDWTGASGVQHWTTNLIGTGIVPRFKRITEPAKKILYTDMFKTWTKTSDSDCVLDFFGQQTLATRSWLESGELFARMRIIKAGKQPIPLRIQLLEADYIPMLDTNAWAGLPVGNIIRSGVEFDPDGERVAFWSYISHPSDYLGLTITTAMLQRVPASEMLHVFEPKRPGQIRGVPEFAPVLARLRNVADFDDAVLERQKLANLFAAFIKQVIPANWDGNDPMTGKPIELDKNGTPMAPLQPGTTQELLAGEEIVFSNPPEAGTTYSEYMRGQNLGTAAGQGLPYELMSGDIANISDRTLRIIVNEFRRYAEQRQWQIIIPMLCQKIIEKWVDIANIVGLVDDADVANLKLVEWSPHGWEYIHPVQDVEGKQIAVDSGFRSRSSVIAENGDDPDEVDAERLVDQEREDALGLTPPALTPTIPLPPGESKKPPDPAAMQTNAQTDLLRAQTAMVKLQTQLARERGKTDAEVQKHVANAAAAEADFHVARAAQSQAEAAVSTATVDRIKAEQAQMVLDAAAGRAAIENKSKADVKAAQDLAAAGRREVDARIAAVATAEAFAVQQRELVMAADKSRVAMAALELEAAQLGLDELREG